MPCDLLILSASVVVNEAILTGESQPLVKEGIANLDETEQRIETGNAHRNNLLHSGTDILQFTPADDIMEEVPQLTKPPAHAVKDGGVVCYVLKNGFETK